MIRKAFLSLTFLVALTRVSPLAAQAVSVTFSEDNHGGYGGTERHITAVWVETSSGAYVRTLGLWAQQEARRLSNYRTAATGATDATASATLRNYTEHTLSWDRTDADGLVLSSGAFRLRFETYIDNSTAFRATFPFSLDGPINSNENMSGFQVQMSYTPAASMDAGVAMDSGTMMDAGTPPRDAGVSVDAGAQVDSSVVQDAGGGSVVPDSSVTPQDSGTVVPDSGATDHTECRAAEGHCSAQGSPSALMATALLLLVLRRRRRAV